MNAPIYLLGCHRSGTTLLRFLLDSHSNICCPPETKFLAAFPLLLSYPQALTGLQTSLDWSKGEYLANLRAAVTNIYGKRLKQLAKHTIIDKTPNYFRLVPFLRDLFESDVRFIVLVRHPFDCALSLRAYFCDPESSDRLVYQDDPDINEHVAKFGCGIDAWCKYWLHVNHTIKDSSNDSDTIVVRYEDLVCEPLSTVSRILHFIGETDESQDMVALAFKHHHIEGGLLEDKSIRATTNIHHTSIGKWRTCDERWSLYQEVVRELAEQFGYSVI